jgi:hypothetical protein
MKDEKSETGVRPFDPSMRLRAGLAPFGLRLRARRQDRLRNTRMRAEG